MVKETLERVKKDIESALSDIEDSLEKGILCETLSALAPIEEYYKKYCEEIDKEVGDPVGTAYTAEVPIDFTIEIFEWRKVSRVLRKISKTIGG